MHCCGNVKDLLPLIIDMGITGIQPLQPNCNNIYELKKEYEGKITFFGNIDIAGVLSFGKPKDVIEDTKKHIDHLAHGGGYVVASSHSIIDTVPFENYIAMIQTAQTYTDYKKF
jgi:uroporphyrinogen decarboxylase